MKYYMDYAPPVLSETALGKQPQTHPSTVFTHGFSVNYLRRIPELHELAKRVVKAREVNEKRELRKKSGSATANSSAVQNSRRTSSGDTQVRTTRRMKRLFEWAIRELYDEGSIVIFEGPSRPSKVSSDLMSSRTGLWRDITNTTATGDGSSRFNGTTATTISMLESNDSFDGTISDPQPHEECYIPLTTAFLENPIASAIRNIQAHDSRQGRGVTAKEVLNCLARNERWGRIGECTVNDALKEMRAAGKVRKSDGAWTLL